MTLLMEWICSYPKNIKISTHCGMDIHKYEHGERRSLAKSIYQILSRREFVTPEDKTELKKKICHLRPVKEAIIYNLKMKTRGFEKERSCG